MQAQIVVEFRIVFNPPDVRGVAVPVRLTRNSIRRVAPAHLVAETTISNQFNYNVLYDKLYLILNCTCTLYGTYMYTNRP